MYLALTNIIDREPRLIQVPSFLVALYYEYRKKKLKFLMPFAAGLVIFLFLYLNNTFNFLPLLNFSDLTLIHLVGSCACIFGTVYWLIWNKDRACLMYVCLGMDGLGEYMDGLLETLNKKLSAEEMITSLASDRDAKKLWKLIHSAQIMREMITMVEEETPDDVINTINKNGIPEGFNVKIIKYGV